MCDAQPIVPRVGDTRWARKGSGLRAAMTLYQRQGGTPDPVSVVAIEVGGGRSSIAGFHCRIYMVKLVSNPGTLKHASTRSTCRCTGMIELRI
jgi:hypothetical protein